MSAKLPPCNHHFAILNSHDHLIFETEITSIGQTQSDDDFDVLKQCVTHASMDLIDQLQWRTQNMFLKCVDKFEEWFVSALVAPSLVRFVIAHNRNDEQGIRNFLNEALELYIKTTMNPFYEEGTQIRSGDFEERIQSCGKKHLCL